MILILPQVISHCIISCLTLQLTSSQEREREKKRNQYSIFVKPTVRNPIQKKEKKLIEIGQAQSTKKKDN